jgi:hypothetical protein
MRAETKRKRATANCGPITESGEFKAWFGESKVTDSNGRPLVMYHGTYIDFDAFHIDHAFHCFTPDPLVAEQQANDSQSFFRDEPEGAAVIIMPFFLRVLRPFDPRTYECAELMAEWGLGIPGHYDNSNWEVLEDLEVVARIKSLGFDGIWMKRGEFYDTIAIFHPRQVKSSIGNSGRFNPDSNSLTDQGQV